MIPGGLQPSVRFLMIVVLCTYAMKWANDSELTTTSGLGDSWCEVLPEAVNFLLLYNTM